MVRVKFRVSEGLAAAETQPRLPNSDGSVEWTEPIELRVDDSQVLLTAVVSQRQKGSWCMVNGGRFKGPTVDSIKSGDLQQWSPTSPVSPRFYTKAEVYIDDVPQGDVGFPLSAPTAPFSVHVGVDASSGSHDPLSMSRGTSLSSTSYGSGRDWLPATAPPGARAPSGMLRAQSEGTDMGVTRAQPSIPTVAAVPVDPLGVRTSPIFPHASAVQTDRGSWTAGSSEPPQELSMRRTRSEVYVRQGNDRRHVREGSGRSRWPSFGSRGSSSHTDDSLIREESPAQSVDINSLTSPVGTYREPRLLDERVPLAEDVERAEEALESSEDLTRFWSGPALAGEIGRMTEEAKTESRPPPFAPEVNSQCDVSLTSIGGEPRSKERRQSALLPFWGKTKRGPLAAGGMGPQFRSEYTDDGSRRVEKMTGRSRRRLSAEPIAEDMKPTEPTVDLGRPDRVLHRMPLQEAKARDEPWALSPVGEAESGIVGSDGEETDSVAAEEVAESQQVDSTVIRAGATAEEVKLADSTVAKATKDEAGTSPERPSRLKVDGLRHKPTMQEYEHIPPARRKPPLPARSPNILGSKAFMSPLGSPPDIDARLEEESPSRPAPSAPPLSPTTPRLMSADAFPQPRPEVGSCSRHDEECDDFDKLVAKASSLLLQEILPASSPVSHDEEEKDDGYLEEDSTKPFPVRRLEIPASRPLGYSRVTGEDLKSFVGGYTRSLFNSVMQPNLSIQYNAPNPDRAVGKAPVIFDCFAPRTVVRGMSFDLVIFAYLRQQREEVLRDAQRRGTVEASMPKTIPIMLNKRVTVVLVSQNFYCR